MLEEKKVTPLREGKKPPSRIFPGNKIMGKSERKIYLRKTGNEI
jgi:hypothetical protein